MRLATIRTQAGTTAAQLEGDLLIPLDAADVGEWLAGGGEGQRRERAEPVSAAEADFAPVVPRPGRKRAATRRRAAAGPRTADI